MSYIEELRKRVESAEQRFGLIDEQQRRYSERLITLMNALETARGEQQTQIDSAHGRVAELERENGELRGMLHALLLGVEAGSRDTLADTLRDLDGRLSTMLGAAPRAAEPAAEAPMDEAPVDEGAKDEAPAAEAEGLDAIDLAGAAAAVVAAAEAVAEADEDVVAEAPEQSEIAAEATAEAVDEARPDEAAAEEEEIVAVDEAEAEDPVAAAEQAVADLIGTGAEGGAPDEIAADADAVAADDETVFDEPPADSAVEGAGAASPVGEMIERLAEETQDFPEPEVADQAEAAPAAPAPARKKA